jgi:hypothetical protein
VAARKDGTKVVSEQWVDDSLDLGEMADADRVSFPFPFFIYPPITPKKPCILLFSGTTVHIFGQSTKKIVSVLVKSLLFFLCGVV